MMKVILFSVLLFTFSATAADLKTVQANFEGLNCIETLRVNLHGTYVWQVRDQDGTRLPLRGLIRLKEKTRGAYRINTWYPMLETGEPSEGRLLNSQEMVGNGQVAGHLELELNDGIKHMASMAFQVENGRLEMAYPIAFYEDDWHFDMAFNDDDRLELFEASGGARLELIPLAEYKTDQLLEVLGKLSDSLPDDLKEKTKTGEVMIMVADTTNHADDALVSVVAKSWKDYQKIKTHLGDKSMTGLRNELGLPLSADYMVPTMSSSPFRMKMEFDLRSTEAFTFRIFARSPEEIRRLTNEIVPDIEKVEGAQVQLRIPERIEYDRDLVMNVVALEAYLEIVEGDDHILFIKETVNGLD